MTITEALQRLMKEEGLNNNAFAQLLAVSHGTVSRYVSGSRIPPIHRLKQIAKIFNRRLDVVIENDNISGRFIFRDNVRDITFDKKIEQCRGALLRYALGNMHLKKEVAEDLVQDTILKGLLLHYTWRPEVAMTTWLIGIQKRSIGKYNSKLVYVENYVENDRLTEESENVFKNYPKLFNYIEHLGKTDKDYYKLYANGIDYKTIALQMNTTEKYVKTRIHVIKQQIRKKMESASMTY